MGKVVGITHRRNLSILKVRAKKILPGTKRGDSIACNGVCLTVRDIDRGRIVCDMMRETVLRTTLGTLRPSEKVNLERALKAHSRFHGHFVTGHVDGVGTIVQRIEKKNYVELSVRCERSPAKYLVPKGSVTIDGVSLTIGKIKGNMFSVHLIPFTLKVTTLGRKGKGEKVNIETDILAKYVV